MEHDIQDHALENLSEEEAIELEVRREMKRGPLPELALRPETHNSQLS